MTELIEGFFHQSRGGTCLNACAARHTLRIHEVLHLPGRYLGGKTAAVDGQRESSLGFFAGSDTPAADDALAGIEREVRIGGVLRPVEVIGAIVAVSHFAQSNSTRHILQFAVAVGRAGQAIERVVGDVELHHATADILQPLRLRLHHHARHHRGGAGGWRPGAALDLHQAQPA